MNSVANFVSTRDHYSPFSMGGGALGTLVLGTINVRSKECVLDSKNVPFNLSVPQSIPTSNEQMNVLSHIHIFCVKL